MIWGAGAEVQSPRSSRPAWQETPTHRNNQSPEHRLPALQEKGHGRREGLPKSRKREVTHRLQGDGEWDLQVILFLEKKGIWIPNGFSEQRGSTPWDLPTQRFPSQPLSPTDRNNNSSLPISQGYNEERARKTVGKSTVN